MVRRPVRRSQKAGARSEKKPRRERRFPTSRDVKVMAEAGDDFARAHPDELGRLLVAFGIDGADIFALQGKRLVDVLYSRFREVKPIEDDVEAIRASGRHKWLASLGTWLRYVNEGEDAALEHLPYLFEVDCAFFLRQRWVAEMIARWRAEGDEARVHALFFGTPKAGVPRYAEARARWERDKQVCGRVYLLMQEGHSADKAYKIVGSEIHRSPEAVRSLYESRMKSWHHPFVEKLAWKRRP